MATRLTADFAGAFRKTAVLKRLPKASKHVIGQWAADTVLMLKRRASSMQKSGKTKHTGYLSRNIGMEASVGDAAYKVILGTGVGRTQSAVYASIQDKGGVIKKKDKHLTIPLGSTKGRIRNFPGGFFFKSKSGNLLYAQRAGSGKRAQIKPLFVLKDQVTIPATHWFSGITGLREKDLTEALKPEHVLKVAEGMSREAGI